jgi:hypothetical protein
MTKNPKHGPYHPAGKTPEKKKVECLGPTSPNGKHSFIHDPDYQPPNIGQPKPKAYVCQWCGAVKLTRKDERGVEVEIHV